MGNKKHEISILGFLQSIPIPCAPAVFGKSVNSISTGGGVHDANHITKCTAGFSVITMALM